MKRIVSLMMVFVTVLLAVSCGTAPADQTDTAASTTAASVTGTDVPAETEPPIPENERDDLPEMNFNGAPFMILSRKATSYEVDSKELTGDLIKDAVFNRNIKVEERFGVEIGIVEEPGQYEDRSTFIAKVGEAYMSGADTYDLIMTHSAYIIHLGLKGYAYNMSELENMDFNKKWWCKQYTDNVNIDGMIFSAVGDLTYSLYERMQCMFFNKKLAADNNVPDLYAIVNDGQWTLDKMQEIALSVGSDLDGNGTYDWNDLYGMAINNHTCRAFSTTFDTQMTVEGEDGRREINMPNEKYIDVYNRVLDFIWNNSQVRFDNDADSQLKYFRDDKALLFSGRLGNAVSLKDMNSEYGIIPFPKYDADQPEYITTCRDYVTAMAIFGNLSDPVKTSVVTEALCMLGYQEITPAYYETSLKYKYLSDATAMQMLDRIRDGLTMSFTMTFTDYVGGYGLMGQSIEAKTSAIAAQIKANLKNWTKLLDQLYADYAALKK